MTPTIETVWDVTFTDFETNGDQPISFVPSIQQLTVASRACIIGESYTEEETCELCAPGFYLFEAQTEPGVCKECDQEVSECFGGASTTPLAGFWRSRADLDQYTECPFGEDSCLKGSDIEPLGVCSPNSGGIACSKCDNNYIRSKDGLCEECPSK